MLVHEGVAGEVFGQQGGRALRSWCHLHGSNLSGMLCLLVCLFQAKQADGQRGSCAASAAIPARAAATGEQQHTRPLRQVQ